MNTAARVGLAVAAAGILVSGGWFGGWSHAHHAAVGDWVRRPSAQRPSEPPAPPVVTEIRSRAGLRDDGCGGNLSEVGDPKATAALAAAVRRKDWKSARYFIAAGAADPPDLAAEDAARLGRERLSYALYIEAERGRTDEIRRLLEDGADPNFKVRRERLMSPLARAATCDEPASIRELIAGGAKVDLPLSYEVMSLRGMVTDTTALIVASEAGSAAAVRELIAAGADVNRRDCGYDVHEDRCVSRRSALDVAGTAEIKAMLRAAGARR